MYSYSIAHEVPKKWVEEYNSVATPIASEAEAYEKGWLIARMIWPGITHNEIKIKTSSVNQYPVAYTSEGKLAKGNTKVWLVKFKLLSQNSEQDMPSIELSMETGKILEVMRMLVAELD